MVNYLVPYICQQTNKKAVYKVDIKNEVENFKRKHPDVPKPVVIFDFNGIIPILLNHYTEVLCGGRHSECIGRAETLFKKFQDLGVDLVFFLDGPIKEMKIPEWLGYNNRQYEKEKILFANLKAQEPIQYYFQKYLKTYHDNCLRVARKYGRVFISFQNECHLDIAEYAARTKALAGLGIDSDFLVMPGDWPIWVTSKLNVRQMTVDVWDKRKLRLSLGLEQWQMPILATLSGTHYIAYKHVEHLWKPFTGDLVQVQNSFAGFIRQTFQNREDLCVKITDLIYNGGSGKLSCKEIERLVKISFNLYDYKHQKITRPDPQWLRNHILQTASCHVYSIYYQKVLRVNHPFVDISREDVGSFSVLVLPIMLRQIGIMHSNSREAFPDVKQSICLKPSEGEPFCMKEYTPIHPDFEVPEIETIASNNDASISLEKRIEILCWVASPKDKMLSVGNVLKLLKTVFIVPALILNYLVQERQITADEADILLLTILEASKMDAIGSRSFQTPETVTERPFWLSHLYTNLVQYFDEAMIFCGLYTYVPFNYFDGFIFHKIYAEFLEMTFDEKLKMRKSIVDYRLFGV